jgi:hypothetical protein
VIDLARHLEVLLLSNDCVAVPGFGGFVAHYVAAHIDEEDGMFLPPMRTIGFNPQLKMNDSLLAQSYVEAYDISYPEALRRIEQETEEIRRHIMYAGSFQLEGIGTLTSNDEGNYYFTPSESGLLTPSLYGLDSFEFSLLGNVTRKPIETVKPVEQEPAEEKEEESQSTLLEWEDDEDESAINIKMSWIRNTVAVAAAIALFFLLTTPVANSNMGSQTMSALQNSFLHKLMPKDSNWLPATPVTTPKNVVITKKEVSVDSIKKKDSPQETPQKSIQPTTVDNPYCLVLASQVKRSNAEEFVRMLQKRGFKDTEVYVHNNVVRVVYGHFKSESAAYIELHNLRFEDDFEEAWVYKRKTEG